MTVSLSNVVTSSDTFGGWLTRTNQLIHVMNYKAVTAQSNATIGNAGITGRFSANIIATTNAGFLELSTMSANAIANGQQLVYRSSDTSNTIYSANGLNINGGATLVTSAQIKVGATTINSTAIYADALSVGSSIVVGNTTVGANIVDTYTANSRFLAVSNTASVGDTTANTFIYRDGIKIFNSPLGTYVVNATMNSVELRIQNIYANNIFANNLFCNTASINVISSNTIFTGNNVTFLTPPVFQGNVSITGAGRNFNHGWTAGNNNRSFFYGSNTGGATNLTRNMYENVLGQDTAANTHGQLLRLEGRALRYYTFKNSSAGAQPSLLEEFKVDESISYFSNTFLGIGITSGDIDERLTVNGAIKIIGSTSGWVKLVANTVAGSPTFVLPVDVGTANQAMITDGTGKLGWRTIPEIGPTTDLYVRSIGVGTPASGVNGEIRAAGNITGYYSSDERLKSNVKNISNALDIVKSIRGVEFDWNEDWIDESGGEDGYYVRKHDIGVIAQEVENVLPEIVGTREDGYKAVKYEKLVAVLIEAVKELSAEVDRLKNGR